MTKQERFENASRVAFARLERAQEWVADRLHHIAEGMAYDAREGELNSLRQSLEEAIVEEQAAKLIWKACEEQLRA